MPPGGPAGPTPLWVTQLCWRGRLGNSPMARPLPPHSMFWAPGVSVPRCWLEHLGRGHRGLWPLRGVSGPLSGHSLVPATTLTWPTGAVPGVALGQRCAPAWPPATRVSAPRATCDGPGAPGATFPHCGDKKATRAWGTLAKSGECAEGGLAEGAGWRRPRLACGAGHLPRGPSAGSPTERALWRWQVVAGTWLRRVTPCLRSHCP